MKKLSQETIEKLSPELRKELVQDVTAQVLSLPIFDGIDLPTKIRTLTTRADVAENNGHITDGQLTSINGKIASIKDSADKALAITAQLKREMDDISDENGIASRQIDKLRDDVSYHRAKISEISEEIKRLKAQNERLKEENEKLIQNYNTLLVQFTKFTATSYPISYADELGWVNGGWGANHSGVQCSPTLTSIVEDKMPSITDMGKGNGKDVVEDTIG